MSTGRNSPCPCGSGRKHKRCCLGKNSPTAKRKTALFLIAAVLVIGALGAWAAWASGPQTGIMVALGGAVITALVFAIRNAPESRGRQGADKIDFGR